MYRPPIIQKIGIILYLIIIVSCRQEHFFISCTAVFDNFLPNLFHVSFVKIMGGPYASYLKRLGVLHLNCFTYIQKSVCFLYYVQINESGYIQNTEDFAMLPCEEDVLKV